MTGYLRSPAIHGDDVYFASDDDLWHVTSGGGRADRLTSGIAEASGPRVSPDGTRLAFVGKDEGAPDIYVMASTGGSARRLTHLGGLMAVAGFDPDGSIIFATDAERPFYRDRRLYRIGSGWRRGRDAAVRSGQRHRLRPGRCGRARTHHERPGALEALSRRPRRRSVDRPRRLGRIPPAHQGRGQPRVAVLRRRPRLLPGRP